MIDKQDQLRSELLAHFGAMYLAAAALVRAIDSPTATLDSARQSMPARMCRRQLDDFARWLRVAVEVTPDLQPEEKRFLDYWLKQQEKVT